MNPYKLNYYLLYFKELFLYFSLFSHRKRGGGIEGYCAGGYRLHRSYQARFIAPWCNSRGGKAARIHRCCKKHSKKDFMHHPTPHRMHPIRCDYTATIFKMGPMIVMGSAKAPSSKVKPINGSEPPRATRTRDETTQRMANILAHPVPHRGDMTSSCFVSESRPGGFLHTHMMASI
jgi:hypothetical protein